MPQDSRSVRVVVKGRVQGVWFRAWTAREAQAMGLDGWVRNRADGTVEAVFAGPARMVEDMLAACWTGPPAARVVDVEVEELKSQPAPGFHQLPTI